MLLSSEDGIEVDHRADGRILVSQKERDDCVVWCGFERKETTTREMMMWW
jgi:hypothetical protein